MSASAIPCPHVFPDGTQCQLSPETHQQVPGLATVHASQYDAAQASDLRRQRQLENQKRVIDRLQARIEQLEAELEKQLDQVRRDEQRVFGVSE